MPYTISKLKKTCKGHQVQVFTQARGPGVLYYVIYQGDNADELISKVREAGDYRNVHFLSFDFFVKHRVRNRLGKETEIDHD